MLIGITGFIGSGKDVVGDYFVTNHNFKKDSYAKSLKDAASVIFNWDRDMLEGNTPEHRFQRNQVDKFWSKQLDIKDFTPRLGLQWLGTEAARKTFGDNIWTGSVLKRYQDSGKQNTIITDCRFENEIKLVRDNQGVMIRVKRGPEPPWFQQMIMYNKGWLDEAGCKEIELYRSTGTMPHVSETSWIGCDVDMMIENDGSLEDLETKICKIATSLNIDDIQYGMGV